MRALYVAGILILALSACAPSVAEPIASGGNPASAGSELSEGVVLPEEPPPAGAEGEFSTDFSRHTVPYSEVLSGGVPKDGIRAIDEPRFIGVDDADEWLEDQEPVVAVDMEGKARAYPIQILTWHEIVNDTVSGVPVAVTYCPLCNTAIAFERTFNGLVLDFGTTGRLRALVDASR
jgi:hypothetical protein